MSDPIKIDNDGHYIAYDGTWCKLHNVDGDVIAERQRDMTAADDIQYFDGWLAGYNVGERCGKLIGQIHAKKEIRVALGIFDK